MNSIELAKQYVSILDEVYQNAALTAKLDGNPALVRAGANADELVIPMLDMQGLGDYSRNDGYVKGNVTLEYKTVKCNFDRGRMFNVDTMDNLETAGVAFGHLSGEFIRTKVVPELDAFRFARYAGKDGISKLSAGADLSGGEDVLSAIRAGTNRMDEDEVPFEDRHLFITPTLHGMIQDLDTTKSREILSRFDDVTLVPQTRFYTAIAQRSGRVVTGDGETVDETAGGFAKAPDGKNINFMIIHRPAVLQFSKHIAPKIVTPRENQDADGYKFGYRHVALADVYQNKLAGVYLHYAAS